MAKQARKDPLVWGVILIIVGLMFLLKFDIWYALAHFWPVILIIWGAYKLYYGFIERKEEPKSGITKD